MRDAIRHVLALVLMAGTLAGTIWTFSNGMLTLNGAWERLVSVGGIAAALECGVIYCGWFIGQLDLRIQTARKADIRDELRKRRVLVFRWFYVVASISALANLIFRTQQLDNFPLALFVSVSPVALIILFTVILIPLPKDYDEMARQTSLKSLVSIQEVAGEVMVAGMRRMVRGDMDEESLQRLAFASSFVMPYAPTDQQHALAHVLAQRTGAETPRIGGYVESSVAERWYTTREVADLYQLKERTAQLWVAQTPGRRKVAKGNGWEVPASALYAARGIPAPQTTPARAVAPLPGSAEIIVASDPAGASGAA